MSPKSRYRLGGVLTVIGGALILFAIYLDYTADAAGAVASDEVPLYVGIATVIGGLMLAASGKRAQQSP